MEAKLIKNRAGEYYLAVLHKNLPNWFNAAFELSDGYYSIASSINIDGVGGFPLLSLKNCQAIERGYDLDELADDFIRCPEDMRTLSEDREINSFKKGFQKALEILGDRKFTERDINAAIRRGYVERQVHEGVEVYFETYGQFLQSLQQNEWEVEVEIEYQNTAGKWFSKPTILSELNRPERPKLDAEGCLILKRVV